MTDESTTSMALEATEHEYVIVVSNCTRDEANRVIAERIGFDEDYGFAYTIDYVTMREWQATQGEVCESCFVRVGERFHDPNLADGISMCESCYSDAKATR